MPAPPDDDDEGLEFPHVSTGHLPPSESIAALVAEAHARYKLNIDGDNSPLLDGAGNSVKGQLVAKFLSHRLGMDLFVSKADISAI
jgi:hypothetical protein